MANRLPVIFQQFFDATPNVREGSVLRFYAAGTSTPLAVYSDKDLQDSIGTSVTLNELGQPSTAVFLSNVSYKVTLEDANGVVKWTADDVATSDVSARARVTSGSGSPALSVAGTAGSAATPADVYWDFAARVLYICVVTGSALTAQWVAINSSSVAAVVPEPQGRLTLLTATPVMTTTVSGASEVYYTPYVGNLLPIYNGAAFTPFETTQLTLSIVASHTANTNFDVFAFSNSGVLTLVTGPAWSSSSARGTGAGTTELTRIAGKLVNAVSITGRNGATTYSVGANLATYLGTIRTNGTSTIDFSFGFASSGGGPGFFGVWNAYHRVLTATTVSDTGIIYGYTSATIRQSRGSAGNQVSAIIGLIEDAVQASASNFGQTVANAGATMRWGVGLNSTSSYASQPGILETASAVALQGAGTVFATMMPALGFNIISANESSDGTNTNLFNAGNGGNTFQVSVRH